jgi:hypothetical protein
MFMPCPNAPIATRQITAVGRVQGHSTYHGQLSCAIAAYHNSWDRPDNKFADAVLTSVAKGDALNFDMPDDVAERSNGAPR